MMKNILLALFGLLAFDFQISAQPVLNSFTVSEREGIVYLNWEITQGFTCNGTVIERAPDSIHFEAIGEIDGICGSTTEAVPYDFTDTSPLPNQTNYYRLRLGDAELSPVRKAEVIELGSKGYQVQPNPIRTEGKIYFNNPRQQEHLLQLYDMKATIIAEYQTSTDHFDLNLANFQAGAYLFSIVRKSDDELIVSGKLIAGQ